MLTYTTLKDNPRQFIAMTSLTRKEFETLLPAFATAYAPPNRVRIRKTSRFANVKLAGAKSEPTND